MGYIQEYTVVVIVRQTFIVIVIDDDSKVQYSIVWTRFSASEPTPNKSTSILYTEYMQKNDDNQSKEKKDAVRGLVLYKRINKLRKDMSTCRADIIVVSRKLLFVFFE